MKFGFISKNLISMTKEEIREFLVEEAELDQIDVNSMSDWQLFNRMLYYQGIIGFTNDIIEWYKACFEESTLDNLE